ncbi:MAG: lipoyl(octanoyl) transferase LipB [Chloroflexi bacterium]|nr:lipoyl(octanoyl) transferase LipB [Chloroflexota bacterium]
MTASHRVGLLSLAREPYTRVQALQNRLVDRRQRGEIGDTLILLEHTPVITLGRRADPAHILADADELAAAGVEVCPSERGGDVTYHGPGQLVGYPILYLPDHNLGASDYMHRLEDVVALALSDFGIRTHRRPGIIGVWVGENKIAALGVRVRGQVTYHGLALNVAPDMRHWALIIPCGITDGGVTSMALELGHAPPMVEVRARLAARFCELFDAALVPVTEAELDCAS